MHWPNIFQGIAYTFNIVLVSIWDVILATIIKEEDEEEEDTVTIFGTRYPWYVFYWFVTMIQNTILISIWFAATVDAQLWYRIPAIMYVIVAYLVSFIVKTVHTSKRNKSLGPNIIFPLGLWVPGVRPDWDWQC